MRLLRAKLNWGLGPQTPRIYRFFPARMEVFEFIQGTGPTCPPPFRPLSRSLGLLPSMALSSAQLGLIITPADTRAPGEFWSMALYTLPWGKDPRCHESLSPKKATRYE